jgi:hypothetical protein
MVDLDKPRRFLREDYETLCSMYKSQNQEPPSLADLPSYGLIVPNVAAGFLILTDARVGFLEYFITNKESDKWKRWHTLDQITEGLIDYGKKFGLKYFKADTQLVCIGQRAMRHGFEYMGKYSLYFKRS